MDIANLTDPNGVGRLSVSDDALEPGHLILETTEGLNGVTLDWQDIKTLRDTLSLFLEGNKFDAASSGSRQFFIETGRYLTVEEVRLDSFVNESYFFVDEYGDVWAYDETTDYWDVVRMGGFDFDLEHGPSILKGFHEGPFNPDHPRMTPTKRSIR